MNVHQQVTIRDRIPALHLAVRGLAGLFGLGPLVFAVLWGVSLLQPQDAVPVPGAPSPFELRYRLAWDHELCRAVLEVFPAARLSASTAS